MLYADRRVLALCLSLGGCFPYTDAPSPTAPPAADVPANCGATTTDTNCGRCGNACSARSYCAVSPTAGTRCLPRDCAAARASMRARGAEPIDGDYEIDPDGAEAGRSFRVYCADMDTDAPREYLPVSPETNLAAMRNGPSCGCVFTAQRWRRLRLRILTDGPDRSERAPGYAIDAVDNRFVTPLSGPNLVPGDTGCVYPTFTRSGCEGERMRVLAWGGINSCSNVAPYAHSIQDLTGTPFVFPPMTRDQVFESRGPRYMPMVSQYARSADNRRINARYSAECGFFAMHAWPDNNALPSEFLVPIVFAAE